jgi:hypothetical protein
MEAPELSLASVAAAWPGISARATPASVKMSVKNGRVTAVTDKSVTISFVSKFHRDRIAQQDASRSLEDLLQKHFKRPLRIECIVESERGVTAVADSNLVDLAEAVTEIF